MTTPTHKSLNQLLAFLNLCQHEKNLFILPVHFSDTVNFRVQTPDWPHPFLTMPYQKIFNQILIFVNLYQHAKIEAVSSICSGQMVDLKILQSE